MKTFVTKNSLRGFKVICAGNGDAKNLLMELRPFGYNSGVYGWNYDAYQFNGIIVCHGDRHMPGVHCDFLRDYEKKAADVYRKEYRDSGKISYDVMVEKITALRAEFAARVLAEV